MINQVLLAPSLATVAANITRVQATSANTNVCSISSTTANDLIIVCAFNNASTTIPTTVIGYNNIANNSTTGCAMKMCWKRSSGGETSVGTWSGATNLSVIVLRGALATATPIGTVSTINAGNSATITYQALTFSVTNGTSWALGFAGAKAATAGMNGNTAELTNETAQTIINGLDTNGTRTVLNSSTLSVTGSGRWLAFTCEVLSS